MKIGIAIIKTNILDGIEVNSEICLEDDTMFSLIRACRKFGFKDLIKE
jgi:hypothetical protein